MDPTAGYNGRTETFSISESDQTCPADVLEEIVYFPIGGDDPWVCDPRHDFVLDVPDQMELPEEIWIDVCGWEAGETVEISIQLPDGRTITSVAQAKLDEALFNETKYKKYYVNIRHFTALTDPIGQYVITFRGNQSGKTVRGTIQVSRPSGPKYYHGKDSVFLYNFSANERVRLFAYQKEDSLRSTTYDFVGWQEFRVNSNGQLLVYIDGSFYYFIIGDVSGEVKSSMLCHDCYDGFRSIRSGVAQSERSLANPTPKRPTDTPVSSAVCDIPVYSAFQDIWSRRGGAAISCPTGSAFTRDGAYEYFEHGLMIWHAGPKGNPDGMIYVIYDGGNWQEYHDTFVNGQPESGGYQAPSGLQEPIRGFGKVWREKLGGPSSKIGWALSSEQASQVTIQPFDGTGVIISCDIGTYFLPHGLKWNQ